MRPPASLGSPPGRAPVAERHTNNKGQFFLGGWRKAWPYDFGGYTGGKV